MIFELQVHIDLYENQDGIMMMHAMKFHVINLFLFFSPTNDKKTRSSKWQFANHVVKNSIVEDI